MRCLYICLYTQFEVLETTCCLWVVHALTLGVAYLGDDDLLASPPAQELPDGPLGSIGVPAELGHVAVVLLLQRLPESSSSDSRSVRTTSLAPLRYTLGSTFPAFVFSFGAKMDFMSPRTPSSLPPLLSSSALAGIGAATGKSARPRRREVAWDLLVIGSLAALPPALFRDSTRESIKCESHIKL
jgi:hypothetical protein